MTSLLRILALVAALVGIAPAAMAQSSPVTLKVASFAGPFSEALQKYAIDLFTRHTGIKVELQFGNPPDHLAKLIASRGREAPFDVVCLDDGIAVAADAAGVLAPLDPAIVTNLANLYPEAIDKKRTHPTIFYFSFVIAYNTAKLKEAGIPEPKSWKDLWDPRLAGKVAVPDMAAIHGRDFVVQMARTNGGSESTPEKGIDEIAKIKAHSYVSSSNVLQALLQSGDVWVAPWNNMRAAQMMDRKLPIAFSTPAEGTIGNSDTVSLAVGSRHPKEAQMLINYMLDAFAQLGMARILPTGPSNKLLAAVVEADPELIKKAPAALRASHKSMYLPDWNEFNKNLKKATDHWNRVMTK